MATPNTAPLLRMDSISKSFPGVQALKSVSFDINPGEVHALMGENGAGKSTLIKILAGAQQADSGSISIDGKEVQFRTPQQAMNHGVQIIYQEFNLVPHLTVAENVFLGHMPQKILGVVNFRSMRDQASSLLQGLGITLDPNVQVGGLSNAQKQFVEIAKATSQKARVIAMDEPSATLTDHEQENLWRLVQTLRSSGVAVIYISHRMEEVFKLADRITVLRDGVNVATHKIADTSPESLVREMVGRPLGENFPPRPSEQLPETTPLLEVKNLTRSGVVDGINLTVNPGEIVALAGLVGAGRTEIARCIFGADKFDSGEIKFCGKPFKPGSPRDAIRAGIGFVTEDRKLEGLVLTMSVRENISLASLDLVSKAGTISVKRERAASQEYVTQLSIRTPSSEQETVNLSGGNQQKVALAKWLFRESKLLILDEPTRGIDIGAKVEIYSLIRELASQGIGILMISSELPEVLGLADKIIVIRRGKVAGEISGIGATQEQVGRLAVGV